jgi:hypothetical protein
LSTGEQLYGVVTSRVTATPAARCFHRPLSGIVLAKLRQTWPVDVVRVMGLPPIVDRGHGHNGVGQLVRKDAGSQGWPTHLPSTDAQAGIREAQLPLVRVAFPLSPRLESLSLEAPERRYGDTSRQTDPARESGWH